MTTPQISLVLFSEVNSKFGHPYLQRLISHPQISVEALVTSPDGAVCNYYVGEPNPVNLEAKSRSHGIPVFRPDDVNSDGLYNELASIGPDYSFIANYQQIFKKRLLDLPEKTTINFHPSPLPRYAGRAPFFWMAKNGETDAGVSAIETAIEIDQGPIVKQRPVELIGTENAHEIRDRLFEESEQLLQGVIKDIVEETLDPVPQDLTKRTYYGKVSKEDRHINWTEDAETILRTIRASYRDPGAFTINEDGEVIRILRAERHDLDTPDLDHIQPGFVQETTAGVFVATGSEWIRIKAICVDGKEVEIHSVQQYSQLTRTLVAQPTQITETRSKASN